MPTTRLVSRLCSGVRLLTNGMLTNSAASSRLVENLPLINSNDYLWCVKWQRDIFVVALVSNQWKIAILTCKFSTKCLRVEIFSTF